jgi:hypothetical protein
MAIVYRKRDLRMMRAHHEEVKDRGEDIELSYSQEAIECTVSFEAFNNGGEKLDTSEP